MEGEHAAGTGGHGSHLLNTLHQAPTVLPLSAPNVVECKKASKRYALSRTGEITAKVECTPYNYDSHKIQFIHI